MNWGLRHMSYEERLKDLDIWSLEELRNRAGIIEVFRILKGFSAVGMYDLFDLSTVGPMLSNRGHTLKLAKHRTNTDLRKYFFQKESSIGGIVWTKKASTQRRSTSSRTI